MERNGNIKHEIAPVNGILFTGVNTPVSKRPVVPVYARFLDRSISAFQSISWNSEGDVFSQLNV
jgi:hypothetical protein